MFTATEQFITQMKFRELRTQREQAGAAYDRLERQMRAARDDAEAVRILYDGLRALTFAKQPLHPDTANLEPLLEGLEHAPRQVSPETLAFWRAELERELARGRLRAEIVYIFGALLEEWAGYSGQDQVPDPHRTEVQAELLEHATQPAQAPEHGAFVAALLGDLGLDRADLDERMRQAARDAVHADLTPMAVDQHDLQPILEHIAADAYRSPAIRGQARTFLGDATLQKELADALTILLDHLDEWDWPEEGVPARALWASSKWRLCIDEDLPTACLLELLARRWANAFEMVLSGRRAERVRRLQRLLELGAPAIIIDNERNMLTQLGETGRWVDDDIWVEGEPAAEPAAGASVDELLAHYGQPGSVFAQRAAAQAQLRDFDRFDSYGDAAAVGGLDVALSLVHAEIALGRAAFGHRPLYVIKADLKAFYPSLPHDLMLAILRGFGVSGADLEFFRRYLRTRVRADGGSVTAARGMPVRRRLSDLLGELLLQLLDLSLHRAARVRVVRMLDDICLLAASPDEALAAWDALERFCAACGLALNREKCGAVCIGGVLPTGLPAGRPSWMLLGLDERGEWQLNEPALAAYLESVRGHLARTRSVIGRVDLYNATLGYLEQALALRMPLGESHRLAIRAAIERLDRVFLDGDGDDAGSLVDGLRRAIRERFAHEGLAAQLPEAWHYWPITAGGLGLRHAPLRAAAYALSEARRPRPELPAERGPDWQRRDNSWGTFYGKLLGEVKPAEPTHNRVMETLVGDFISRGALLSAGKQKTLSPYWRWVLYLYGPRIIEEFGTFRFLFSELVPLQLITQRHLGESEAAEVRTGFAGADADLAL